MSAARHSIEASLHACRSGEGSTLALVMATEGSTYSQPGAMAWFGPDAAQVGWLSGGCLEDEIAGHADEAARSGRVGWLEVDTRDDESLLSGSAVGCRGRLCLALLPVSALPGWAALAGAWLQRRGALTVALQADALVVRVGGHDERWPLSPQVAGALAAADAAPLCIDPPPAVALFGAGPETPTLVPLLRQLGWLTLLVEKRPRWNAPAAGADRVLALTPGEAVMACNDHDAALVMHHNFELDREALDALAASRIPFLGLLGPARRREDLFRLLRRPQHDRLAPRLHSPVGLPLGGKGPEAIALSIAAQLQQWRTAPAILRRTPQAWSA